MLFFNETLILINLNSDIHMFFKNVTSFISVILAESKITSFILIFNIHIVRD